MHSTSRRAGVALLVYLIGGLVAFTVVGAPGGTYHPDEVAAYVSPDHFWTAFGFGYLGAFSMLGLLVFGHAAKRLWPALGEPIWGLMIAATTIGITGYFVTTGLVVAEAEGGTPVQDGVPHPVVYAFGEIGNLLSACAPDFFLGVAALLLAAQGGLPRWLRVAAVIGGVCGILLPFYFVIPPYLLFVLAFATWLVARGPRSEVREDATREVVLT